METVFFTLPQPQPGQTAAHKIIWYQSIDGHTFDETPVDETLVVGGSLVLVDAGINRFQWTSSLAVESKYHLIKTEDIYGALSATGIILPPDTVAESSYDANRIDEGFDAYSPGQTIELMLHVDESAAPIIGSTYPVQIIDYWGNLIGQTVANEIGEGTGFYSAQYTIPLDIGSLYNTSQEDESGLEEGYYHLKDVWLFSNNTQVTYNIIVSRTYSVNPLAEDCLYTISMVGVGNQPGTKEVSFTSKLNKYYAPVEDVYSYMPGLKGNDVFDIVRQIINRSNYVDLHMKPNVIHNQEAYNNAVRCYVGKQSALDMTKSDVGITSETKTLDSMQVSKSYDGQLREASFSHDIDKCAMIVYAGGRDTLMNTKVFVKGINDPNRPQVGRGRWDTETNTPFLNYTSKPILITNTDGSITEYRGMRTVGVVV